MRWPPSWREKAPERSSLLSDLSGAPEESPGAGRLAREDPTTTTTPGEVRTEGRVGRMKRTNSTYIGQRAGILDTQPRQGVSAS
jgi:hypothetical protein